MDKIEIRRARPGDEAALAHIHSNPGSRPLLPFSPLGN